MAVAAVKAVVLFQLQYHPLLSPDAGLDTTAYVRLAREVLGGNVLLGPGLFYVSPFYIYFLAAILGLAHSFTAVRVVQILLGTASVGLILLTARRLSGDRAAWIAAGLAALTGLFTFYEVLILQSSVDPFFTSAALYCLALGISPREGAVASRPSPGRGSPRPPAQTDANTPFALAGVTWGWQSLNRPNVLIAAVLVAIAIALTRRRLKPAALLLAGLLAGLAPVASRNVVVSGEWTLVSSHGGLNLYIGNNADATGFYRPVPGVRPSIVGQEIDAQRIATKALGHPATAAEASAYYTDLAVGWMRHHPLAAVGLFLKKFAFAFHAGHVPLPQSYAFFAYDTPGLLRFLFVGPWLLVPLGLIGAAAGFAGSQDSRRAGLGIWISFIPAYAAAVALFFVADRYRLPLMVPLCVCAGIAIDWAWTRLEARRARAVAMAGLAFSALLALVNAPAKLDDGRWTEGLRTAERYVIAGDYDSAERWADWLETHHPPHAGAGQLGVAQQLMALGQYERARPYLERAQRANPSDPLTAFTLGQALSHLGHAREALPYLAQGFNAGIVLPNGGVDYARALVDTGDLPDAVAAIRRINVSDDAPGSDWQSLGRLAMEANAPDVAEPIFRRAAAMQPEDAATRQQYGLNLLVLSRFDEAARELGEAARLDPRNPDTLSRLAYCEVKLGRIDDARRHVGAALGANPGDPLARQLEALLR